MSTTDDMERSDHDHSGHSHGASRSEELEGVSGMHHVHVWKFDEQH